MQTVGEGSFVTTTGFPLPTLNSQVPTAGANSLITAELNYFLEVVPLNGNTNSVPVQIGVNAVGTTSVTTVANSTPDPGVKASGLNDASDFLQLALLSDSSGGAVFSDTVNLHYINGFIFNQGVVVGCDSENTSGATGAGFITGVTAGCGSSTASGGINENGSYSISTNAIYEVVMIANLTVGTANDGLALGSGSVLANEFIDPAFSVPTGYQLVLSDGIGNGAAAPEPGAWMMAAAGLGLIGVNRVGRVWRTRK
jgi:hypothetical protein